MRDDLVQQRRENTRVLAMAVFAYGIGLVDAASWVWLPLLVPLALFGARVVEPRVPAWTLLVVTASVAVGLNIDLNAEGSFFLVCLAAFVVTSESDAWIPDRVLVAIGALSPLVDVAVAHDEVRDWNWPFWSMGVVVSAFFGSVLFQQRRLSLALAEANRRLADQAAGEERRRIAREIHDLVGHSLTVVLLHLTGARRVLARDPDEAATALIEAERVGRQSLADIRRTVGLLRVDSDERDPTPTAQDLGALVDDCRAAGMDIATTIDGPFTELDEATGLAVYRIVQEALANVARHSAGAAAEVNVVVGAGEVEIDVVNGAGRASSAPPGGPGSGVVGMQERAAALGGSLVAAPDGSGWRVTARLPRPLPAVIDK